MPSHVLSVQQRSISLSDLEILDIADFNNRFRMQEEISISIYEIGAVYAGIVVAAPIDKALCAIENMLNIEADALAWSSSRPFDEKEFDLLNSEFRKQGVSKGKLNPAFFLGLATRPYLVKGKYKKLLDSSGAWLGDFRFVSQVVPSSLIGRTVDFYRNAISQFGEMTVVGAAEGVEKEEYEDAWSYNFDHFDPLCLFVKPKAHALREREHEKKNLVFDSLAAAISSVENEGSLPWSLHYKHVVRPPLSMPYGFDNAKPNIDDWGKFEFEVFALRARLIRLLGWPQFFGRVAGQFDNREGVWTLNKRFLDDSRRDQLWASMKDVKCSYDPIAELDAYICEMTERYPILLDSPFCP